MPKKSFKFTEQQVQYLFSIEDRDEFLAMIEAFQILSGHDPESLKKGVEMPRDEEDSYKKSQDISS